MLKKILLLLVATCLSATAAFAQDAQARARFQGKSSIAVTIDGLTCNNSQGTIPALSWNFGVTQPADPNGSGSGAGKATLTDVKITRRADSCTPILFGASVKGNIFRQVTIVQQDPQKDDTFTVTLSEVIISSFQLGGDSSHEVPAEQIGFSFSKICVADTGTGTKSCWDLTLGRAF
jgi:type VI protein secretion system component Hcp